MNDHNFARFMNAVETVTESGCWIWGGEKCKGDYRRFTEYPVRRRIMAHRAAYEHFRGPIPDDLEPDHLCRIRRCVNPWHLELVTHRVNTLRGDTLPARHAKQQACKSGHRYEGENFRLVIDHGRATRRCLICQRERRARFYQRHGITPTEYHRRWRASR
jgi:hypothetical protein